MRFDLVVIHKLATESICRAGASYVIFCWPEAAGRNYYICTLYGVGNGLFEPSFIIANDRFELDLDADVAKLLREPKAIRIDAARPQKLRTDRNDLRSLHKIACNWHEMVKRLRLISYYSRAAPFYL